AGPYAAWMPRKSLQGRTCGVSREGGRARALQRSTRSDAFPPLLTQCPSELNTRALPPFQRSKAWWSCTQATRRPPLLLLSMHTDHLGKSLPAHRRGTLRGMDAAQEPTRTYLRRVLRWWAGKDPAAKLQLT
ncbi:hypothetical protein XarbCFBP8138_16160, partial [Xanthomonas arboricola]